MGMNSIYINLFYGFISIVLLAGSFLVKQKTGGWLSYILVIIGFLIGGLIFQLYFLAASALLAGVVSIIRLRLHIRKNRPLEVILVHSHDDQYLHYFLDYYRADILKFFPGFDFKIEEEFLIALLMSKMETVGLIVAEIKNPETLRICIDYMVPKHRGSQLAKTFYNCELRCIDFLDYKYLYIEPQSKAHNDYLERIGFRLVDGKYVNQCSGK
jgi:hypothetical protein